MEVLVERCAAEAFKPWPFLESPDSFSDPKIERFYVYRVCIQDQSFNNFENDSMELSVKEAKLTGL